MPVQNSPRSQKTSIPSSTPEAAIGSALPRRENPIGRKQQKRLRKKEEFVSQKGILVPVFKRGKKRGIRINKRRWGNEGSTN